MKKLILILSLVFHGFTLAQAGEGDLIVALVYQGPGACSTCITGAANAAKVAGLLVKYVDESQPDESVFQSAKVWIQPGGTSTVAAKAMGETYLARVHSFVEAGGGYVGFCAGAFLATEKIGNTGLTGFGVVPGVTNPLFVDFSPEDHAYLMNMTWSVKDDVALKRVVYFNGGAYFDFTNVNDVNLKVMATYDDYDQKIAAVTTIFGKGKVAVSGAHPEELNSIKLLHLKHDPDGSDQFIAVEMIQSVL